MLKTPFTSAVVKNVSMTGDEGAREGAQLSMSDLAGGTDLGVPVVQFDEIEPAPRMPPANAPAVNVFKMPLGKSLKG